MNTNCTPASIKHTMHHWKNLGWTRDRILQKTVALLHSSFDHYHWTGIYLVDGDELELHSFLGKPSPHVRIPMNQGICGAAASSGESLVVPDVNADPRYLACSIETKSEIVVPIKSRNTIFGEIDVDSDIPDAFSDADRLILECSAAELATLFI